MNQQRVVITGGSGVLGRELTPRLQKAGHTVRILSRRTAPAGVTTEWAQGEIETGQGLAEALTEVDVIIHAASSPFKRVQEVDVEGTGRLLAAAQTAGIKHFLYISIVGIDRVPYTYYQAKLAEKRIEASPIPYSILRTTQFYNLIDQVLQGLVRLPLILPLVADMRFQPIDEGEVADLMVKMVANGPAGRVADAGGPEVKTARELAQQWLAARGMRRRILHLPMGGKVIAGLRQGRITVPDRAVGCLTWVNWLSRHYQVSATPAASSLASES